MRLRWLVQGLVEDKAPILSESAVAFLRLLDAELAPTTTATTASSSSASSHGNSKKNATSAVPSASASSSSAAVPPRLLQRRSSSEPPPIAADVATPRWRPFRGPEQLAGFAASLARTEERRRRLELQRLLVELSKLRSAASQHGAFGLPRYFPNPCAHLGNPLARIPETIELLALGSEDGSVASRKPTKQYFLTLNLSFMTMLSKIHAAIVEIADRTGRHAALEGAIKLLNMWLFDARLLAFSRNGEREVDFGIEGLHIPMLFGENCRQQIVHVHADLCHVFNSATRAPFLLVCETVDLHEDLNNSLKHEQGTSDTQHQEFSAHLKATEDACDVNLSEVTDASSNTVLPKAADISGDAGSSRPRIMSISALDFGGRGRAIPSLDLVHSDTSTAFGRSRSSSSDSRSDGSTSAPEARRRSSVHVEAPLIPEPLYAFENRRVRASQNDTSKQNIDVELEGLPRKTRTRSIDSARELASAAEVKPVERLAECMVDDLGISPAEGDIRRPLRVSPSEALCRQLQEISAESQGKDCSGFVEAWASRPLVARVKAKRHSSLIIEPCARCPRANTWHDIEETNKCVADSATASSTDADSKRIPGPCKSCPSLRRSLLAQRLRHSIWGLPWEERRKQLRSSSPYGRYRSWRLETVIVKANDDLRQELLASQVIAQFNCIFQKARLPLWLKEVDVLVTGSTSGLVECIRDAVSIDSMKKHFPNRSLADIFRVAFADMLPEAQRNFVESCAAYSLVIWFLQIKDRHNANLMMDSKGHVIHIDFGFMLSNSPGGNLAFEQSPFKLTRELIDVMEGESSDHYEYFRALLVAGFLEARKHVERLLLPVRIMASGSKMPCFREGAESVMQAFQERFFVDLTDEACVEKVIELIDTSANNWRTAQYDNYQRLVNGIW
eukprot:TRINITY_DN23863_c0_g1_i1.p1 TRINITY_DN23863_c0_g1~~TRINITY_DN23863_c0_g1_i1.p1  ORF type:complete len:1012 (+),score=171.70 TRINITY_DN23863_c0_g1_i1:329-3037(+)